MSERNGEKSRFQINRKRGVLRRAKIRELLAAGATGAEKQPAHAKARARELAARTLAVTRASDTAENATSAR